MVSRSCVFKRFFARCCLRVRQLLAYNLFPSTPKHIGTRTVRFRGIVVALPLTLMSLLIALGGCGGVLPVSGPATMDILSGQRDPASLSYAIVKVTPKVIDVLAKNAPRLIAFGGDRRRPKDIVFGIGDIVSVTIFELRQEAFSFRPMAVCGLAISSQFQTNRSTCTANSRFRTRAPSAHSVAPRSKCRMPLLVPSRAAPSSRRPLCR